MLISVEQFEEKTPEEWVNYLRESYPSECSNLQIDCNDDCEKAIETLQLQAAKDIVAICKAFNGMTAEEIAANYYDNNAIDYVDGLHRIADAMFILENLTEDFGVIYNVG